MEKYLERKLSYGDDVIIVSMTAGLDCHCPGPAQVAGWLRNKYCEVPSGSVCPQCLLNKRTAQSKECMLSKSEGQKLTDRDAGSAQP